MKSASKKSLRSHVPFLALAVVGLAAFPASAEQLTIVNAGFEDPVLGSGYTDGPIPGWTEFDSGRFGVVVATSEALGTAPEGQNVAWSFGRDLSQVLGSVLTAGAEYTLRVDIGKNYDASNSMGYDIQFLAGGVVLAEDNNSLSIVPAYPTNPPGGGFVTSTLHYAASASDPLLGQSLEIRLIALGTGGSTVDGAEVDFDNVRLQTNANAVPEPGGLVLALTGLACFGGVWQARRRRYAAAFCRS
jgi:hypothetical protein